MKVKFHLWKFGLLVCVALRVEAQTGYTVLHTFINSDGFNPKSGLILSGSTLYGTTPSGNNYYAGYGNVFKVNTDGTGFAALHTFSRAQNNSNGFATNSDGAVTEGNLTLSGSTLYGMAYLGGTNGSGTIFKIDTNGANFSVIKSFGPLSFEALPSVYNGYGVNTNFDGAWPYAGLTLSGSTLYGTSTGGGVSGNGTVFAVSTNGTSFTVLKAFSLLSRTNSFGTLTNFDGAQPYGGLALSGSTLYGTTYQGGTNGSGTVFKINTDGTSFTVLKTFGLGKTNSFGAITNFDGAQPYGGLILSGGVLYGTTTTGGNFGNGTIFKINTDGSSFTVIKTFSLTYPTNSDGAQPYAGLTLSGSTLLGTARLGGSFGNGIVFQVNTDGTSFNVLKTFPVYILGNNSSDGAQPYAGLTLSSNAIYGTTAGGGIIGDGVVFKINLFPIINQQPQSQSVAQSNAVSLTVSATGMIPLGYQWWMATNTFSTAIILSGQTNITLMLPVVTNGIATNYFVVVTNNFGSVTSTVATLTVFLPPQSFIASSTNGNQLNLQFTGTPNYSYILQSATNLTPPVNWQPVLTNPADANGNWQFSDTNLNGSQKFYRALGQ